MFVNYLYIQHPNDLYRKQKNFNLSIISRSVFNHLCSPQQWFFYHTRKHNWFCKHMRHSQYGMSKLMKSNWKLQGSSILKKRSYNLTTSRQKRSQPMRPISIMNHDMGYSLRLRYLYSKIFITAMITCMSDCNDIFMIQKNHWIPRFQTDVIKICNCLNSYTMICLCNYQITGKYVYKVVTNSRF